MVSGVRDGGHLAFQPRRILEAPGLGWNHLLTNPPGCEVDPLTALSATITGEKLDLLGDDLDNAGAAFLRILGDIVTAQRELLKVNQEIVDPARRQEVLACHSEVIGMPYILLPPYTGPAADAQYPLVTRILLHFEEDARPRVGLDVANRKRPIRRAKPDAAVQVDKIERVDARSPIAGKGGDASDHAAPYNVERRGVVSFHL